MLFGLVVMSQNFEMLLQRLVILCFFRPLGIPLERLSVVKILRKNLVSHRRASSGTTSMYSTGLAFVLFITSILQLQYKASSYLQLSLEGSYLNFYTLSNFID